MNLGTTRIFVWTMPPDEGAAEVEEYRFTFASCNMAGSGRYWACIRDFGDWYEEKFGQKHEDALKSDDKEVKTEAFRLQTQAADYGAVMASLRSIDTRTRALEPKEGEEAPAWKSMPVPAEWSTFAGFYDNVPWAVLGALADAAHSANPGLWRFLDNDSAKKNGGVNAG